MSAPKHTAEPWHISGIHPRNIHIGSMDSPMVLASMNDIHTQTPENAARIVACVNYCAGMTAEQLTEDSAEIVREELTRVKSDLDDMRVEWAKAADQRDELAAALRACVDNYYNCEGDEQSCARAGRAALAKLDGAS